VTQLESWLQRIESLHHRPIELGLARVREVAQRLGLRLDCASIVVTGTNGKGSTCAMLDAILRAAGYRVGRYSSPHLLRFNERAAIDGELATDEALIDQFEAVEAARGQTSLTYFEFTTLAVLRLFAAQRLDVAVLEIGLGGRLDAVNIVDADCSIVTSIGLDHADYLGATRESVGFEKAHVYRSGRPAICADRAPPERLLGYARSIGADLRLIGRDFDAIVDPVAGPPGAPPLQWNFKGVNSRRSALPIPSLRGAHQIQNAAGTLAALESLGQRLPVPQQAVREGLLHAQVLGRFQVLPGRPPIVLDVAHNPQAAAALAATLKAHPCSGRTHAVFAMLRDKDAAGVADELRSQVHEWLLAPTGGARGLDAKSLADLVGAPEERSRCFDSVALALAAARGEAGPDDRILVFGSFVTVAEAMREFVPEGSAAKGSKQR
jgi:dihydrofolate synthase / folylpolyglutamate synthase